MGKLWALFNLFRQGSVVADPVLWKHRQVKATLLIPFFAALLGAARAFGHDVPLSDEALAQLSAGAVVAINVVLTFTTSAKVGLPAQPEADAERHVDADAP